MKGNKVILDTNIWVSFFIMNRIAELEIFVYKNELQLFSCDKLVHEVLTVIKRDKFKKYLKESFETYLNMHLDLTVFINIESHFEDSPDPDDNFLFDLALQAKADYLVTGDKKLLAMESVENVEVISLRKFEDMVSGT